MYCQFQSIIVSSSTSFIELKHMSISVFAVPGVEIPNLNGELPPGLIILENYISPEYEQKLLDCVNWEEIDENSSEGKFYCK